MIPFHYDENDPCSPVEIMVRDYLERKIQDHVIPLDKLPGDSQEKLNYDYLDLRAYLQNTYLKCDDFEIEGFGSYMFHIIQNRRESNENLFYMSKILARTKSPLALYMIIYSNYSARMHKKRIKLLYPMDEDFGADLSFTRNFYFPRFELRNYEYPIYFTEIHEFLNLVLENAQGMLWNYNIYDYLDYHTRTILNNKISSDRYEKTLKIGCNLPGAFDHFYYHIAIIKDIPLIKNTILFAIGQIEKFQANPNKKSEVDVKYYVSHQLIPMKYLIDALATTPYHQAEFEIIFQQLDKYPELSDILSKSREKQAKLLKKPDFKYRPRAGTSIEPLDYYGDPDYEKIALLRYGDLNLKLIQKRCKYPERIIPTKSGDEVRNQVRDELGIPRIGEGWANETFLFKLIYMLMEPFGVEAVHHCRPDFLHNQELDIYFEYNNQKVGIEYQGQQHFEPVGYFGGEEAFKQTVERDKRKKLLCDEHGVTLIYFDHGDIITQQLVLKRLKENGIEIRSTDGTIKNKPR